MSEDVWATPLHDVGLPGQPHYGCNPVIFRHPIEAGKWRAVILTAHGTYVLDVHVFDGIPQPDGTRAFPMDYSKLSIHEHPGGRCPSMPAEANGGGPLRPIPGSVTTALAQIPSNRPHLILLEGGKEKAA